MDTTIICFAVIQKSRQKTQHPVYSTPGRGDRFCDWITIKEFAVSTTCSHVVFTVTSQNIPLTFLDSPFKSSIREQIKNFIIRARFVDVKLIYKVDRSAGFYHFTVWSILNASSSWCHWHPHLRWHKWVFIHFVCHPPSARNHRVSSISFFLIFIAL